MADGGNIRAGGAYVELSANDKKFIEGLARAQAKMRSFSSSVKAAGSGLAGGVDYGAAFKSVGTHFDAAGKSIKAAGRHVSDFGAKILKAGLLAGGAFVGLLTIFNKTGSAINDMADRTGLGTDAIQLFSYAAGQTGASMENVEIAVRKMQKSITGAKVGEANPFTELGLAVSDLQKMSPEKQFEAIGQKIAGLRDPTQRAAKAMEIFGKSGTMILPMLAEFAAQSARAKELGLIATPSEIAAADSFGDAIETLKQQFVRIAQVVGGSLASSLGGFMATVQDSLKTVMDWVAANKQMVKVAAAVAVAVVGIGAALVVLGPIIGAVGTAFSALGAVVGGLVAFGTAIGTFIVSPIGLVAAALAAGAAAFMYFSATGTSVAKWLAAQWNILKGDFQAAMGGIVDALAGGNFANAAAIAWGFIKLEWQRGMSWLTTTWTATVWTVKDIWISATTGASAVIRGLWSGLRAAWLNLTKFMGDSWTIGTDAIVNVWRDAYTKIANWILELSGSAMGMTPEQIKKEQETNKKITSADHSADTAATNAKLDAAQAAYDKEIAHISDVDAEWAKMERDRDAAAQRRHAADSKAATDAAAAELQGAKEQFQKSVEAAKIKGTAQDGKNPISSQALQIGGDLAGKLQTSGTFSAFAVAGLGSGIQQQQLTIQKMMEAHLRLIASQRIERMKEKFK